MKLLAIEISRLTALFNVTRLKGQSYMPLIAAALVERYSFAGSPASFSELTADRVDFNHGLFDGSAIDKLEVYGDGVIVSSRSNTDLLDNFMHDLLSWISSEYGIEIVPTRKNDRIHESQLVVSAHESILEPLSSLELISELISSLVKENYGLELKFRSLGYSLSTDPTKSAEIRPAAFRLERRLAAEFELNQFYSIAPLRTSQHLEVLHKIEMMFNRPLS
jgi:hypothetical protein